MQRIAVLGSTGSIGTNCLDVIAALPDQMDLRSVTAHARWESLGTQTRRFAPRWAVVSDPALRHVVSREAFSPAT